MKLVVFGLTITSSWGNGHATTFRGLLNELARTGYHITFFEREAEWYASNRDLYAAPYAEIVLYQSWEQISQRAGAAVREADVVLIGSYCPDGIEITDWLKTSAPHAAKVYYDIDTPITLTQFDVQGRTEYLRADQIPLFDLVLSFTGGLALHELCNKYGAVRAETFYCAIDPEVHAPVPAVDEFRCELGYMGTYAADRQPSVEKFLIRAAEHVPDRKFILAGPQYPQMDLPANLIHYQHLPPAEHAKFYCSNSMTLNVTRDAMRRYGYAPSVRLFEAAGCATCIVSDTWTGIETLFEPDKEILLAESTGDVLKYIHDLSDVQKQEIGQAARTRILADHSYAVRAAQFTEYLRAVMQTAPTAASV